jgi:hypothetical protein
LVKTPVNNCHPHFTQLPPPSLYFQLDRFAFLFILEMANTYCWDHLPLDPTLQIFSYLSHSDLCVVAQVCHLWKQLSEHNEVWRPRIHEFLLTNQARSSPSIPLKMIFKEFYLQFGKYLAIYPRIKKLFNTFSEWINNHYKIAKDIINQGISEEKIIEAERKIGHQFPEGFLIFIKFFFGLICDIFLYSQIFAFGID